MFFVEMIKLMSIFLMRNCRMESFLKVYIDQIIVFKILKTQFVRSIRKIFFSKDSPDLLRAKGKTPMPDFKSRVCIKTLVLDRDTIGKI